MSEFDYFWISFSVFQGLVTGCLSGRAAVSCFDLIISLKKDYSTYGWRGSANETVVCGLWIAVCLLVVAMDPGLYMEPQDGFRNLYHLVFLASTGLAAVFIILIRRLATSAVLVSALVFAALTPSLASIWSIEQARATTLGNVRQALQGMALPQDAEFVYGRYRGCITCCKADGIVLYSSDLSLVQVCEWFHEQLGNRGWSFLAGKDFKSRLTEPLPEILVLAAQGPFPPGNSWRHGQQVCMVIRVRQIAEKASGKSTMGLDVPGEEGYPGKALLTARTVFTMHATYYDDIERPNRHLFDDLDSDGKCFQPYRTWQLIDK